MAFTKKKFNTKEQVLSYLRMRSVPGPDRFDPTPRPWGTDDLFLHVGYSYAEQSDGSWLLVF